MTRELLVIAACYVLGSIPFGLLLVRAFAGTDLRAVGSGNIGATNALRSGSLGLGLATLFLDLLKGVMAALLARAALGPPASGWAPALAGIAAPVVGHCFPVWLRFRGGKGVATGLGVLVIADPWLTLGAALVFLALVVPTRFVALGSIGAACTVAIAGPLRAGSIPEACALVAVAAIVVVRHHENIRRLLAGTESRLGAPGGARGERPQ
ncbi:MAG: glycerol-3-phosphate 1-O-acyltransferase PlsY [Acidobacteriota bacterium]|nr:MAG: glycerol-3-phosphate 1-O-acyltransferase [Acidobacteriota bacterium]